MNTPKTATDREVRRRIVVYEQGCGRPAYGEVVIGGVGAGLLEGFDWRVGWRDITQMFALDLIGQSTGLC
ncbi:MULTISPECIES: hypothetical protein [Burkholderia]|uniref:hypothetical protein n=1 Tax=Burkholderia TaxID=32008 RepID=UPI000CE1BFAB|nr:MULTISPECIES: hypothetical protein [Burkholderia]RQQ21741.1 hypothetical protein DF163_31655 [Burkholderia stagnalis]RQQ23584.1 hypothetical protein DF149_30505 [Burkholderia stagnalis]RQQ41747.1 hypothetical protein DF162_31720 [Burkholderia stagnalis]RQY04859.1 hypothetical protein DF118_31685 [Burkholderia stagnalis]RQY45988.1 hypothetical protein DF112_31180 [Burkholderia stagnalis]